MIRAVALASLILATPAAAQTAAQTHDEVAACVRALPIEVIINEGSGRCVKPNRYDLNKTFPLLHMQSAARQVAEFQAAFTLCPLARPGPNAKAMWRSVLGSYQHSEPDVPAIKAYIKDEVRAILARPRIGTVAYRCEQAKNLYGASGVKVNNGLVMKDGSSNERACVGAGTCRTADSLDVYFY